jgi:hypothetical protein
VSRICQQAMSRKWFQLVGEAGSAVTSATSVRVDVEDVDTFRDAVKEKFKDSHLAGIAAADLTVFANQAAYDATQALEEDAPIASFGGLKKDALIVQVPRKEQQSGLWLVRGSIVNALNTKGVRCRLYRLADSNLGYYDPSLRSDGKDSAIWYEDTTLQIHILFKTGKYVYLLSFYWLLRLTHLVCRRECFVLPKPTSQRACNCWFSSQRTSYGGKCFSSLTRSN